MAASKTPRAFESFICHTCRQRLLPSASRRTLHTTSPLRAANDNTDSALAGLAGLSNNITSNSGSRRKGFNNALNPGSANKPSNLRYLDETMDSLVNEQAAQNLNAAQEDIPYRLHVYSTKHNTHITFVQPPRPASQTTSSGISGTSASAADQKKMVDVLLSLSAGNLGFRKAGRGSYDAAYQLAAFTFKQMMEKGMLASRGKIEVVLRGFGAGREAVTKALLGAEGRHLRGRVSAVVDATRLKLGGPRSKKPRRLG